MSVRPFYTPPLTLFILTILLIFLSFFLFFFLFFSFLKERSTETHNMRSSWRFCLPRLFYAPHRLRLRDGLQFFFQNQDLTPWLSALAPFSPLRMHTHSPHLLLPLLLSLPSPLTTPLYSSIASPYNLISFSIMHNVPPHPFSFPPNPLPPSFFTHTFSSYQCHSSSPIYTTSRATFSLVPITYARAWHICWNMAKTIWLTGIERRDRYVTAWNSCQTQTVWWTPVCCNYG